MGVIDRSISIMESIDIRMLRHLKHNQKYLTKWYALEEVARSFDYSEALC